MPLKWHLVLFFYCDVFVLIHAGRRLGKYQSKGWEGTGRHITEILAQNLRENFKTANFFT